MFLYTSSQLTVRKEKNKDATSFNFQKESQLLKNTDRCYGVNAKRVLVLKVTLQMPTVVSYFKQVPQVTELLI